MLFAVQFTISLVMDQIRSFEMTADISFRVLAAIYMVRSVYVKQMRNTYLLETTGFTTRHFIVHKARVQQVIRHTNCKGTIISAAGNAAWRPDKYSAVPLKHRQLFTRYPQETSPNCSPSQWASCQIHKIVCAHAPGMPGTFCPPPRVSDPHMHHVTCVTHAPWCMPGSLTIGFLWSRRWGKTFPAFPAHAKPAILRIW